MDTNRIQHLISKIYDVLSQKHVHTAIDIDLMLDYTRVMYADMLELRKEMDKTTLESFKSSQPTNLQEKDIVAAITNTNTNPTFDQLFKAEEETPHTYASSIVMEIPTSALQDQNEIHSIESATEEGQEIIEELPKVESGEIYNAVSPEKRSKIQSVEEPPKVNDAQAAKPIEKKDVRKLIGINDKYLFMNELFHNDKFDYESVLDFINESKSLKAVEAWLDKEYIQNKKWNREDSTVDLFYGVASKHFSNFK